jgi:hypothetical protein
MRRVARHGSSVGNVLLATLFLPGRGVLLRRASDDLDREFLVASVLRSRSHPGVEVRSRLLGDRSSGHWPPFSSSRIAYRMTSSGNMEAISGGDRPVVARPAASANFAASRTVALFGVPF